MNDEQSLGKKLRNLGGPGEVVRVGVEAVPAVKYALGIAGIAAALAVARAFF